MITMTHPTVPHITLSPSQQAVLTAAAKHKQGLAIWFPETLKGGARAKVLQALVHSGCLIQTDNDESPRITQAGYQALGIKPPKPRQPKANAATAAPRQNSKQAQVIEMLKRPQGVSIEQVMQATEWQEHYADVLVMPTNVGNPACVAEIAALGSA